MLELTLALPILLFIMALIINYGTLAAWKVRANSVARLAVWETRWPRTGSTDPRPSYWPASATMGSTNQGSVAEMDDSRVDVPVARGPLQGVNVNSDLLDPTRGLCEGSAGMSRTYPLLAKMGSYSITAQTWLVDDKWQILTPVMETAMENATGTSCNNWTRRIQILYYPLAKASGSLVSAYTQAVLAIDNAPFASQLAPLDHDPDFLYYSALFGWPGPHDFQPRFHQICSTDLSLTEESVQNLIDRIQGNRSKGIPGVAKIMTWSFLQLYQQALSAFKGILQQQNPPAPAQMVSLAQLQMPQLQTYIQELQSFLQTLKSSGP